MKQAFDMAISLCLIAIGALILIIRFRIAHKHDNVFSKSTHYQLIVIGVALILFGIIYLAKS